METPVIESKLKGKQSPVPCTKEEIDKIIELAMDDDFYYVLFLVAKKTGRRLGEYYDLKVRDFDPVRKTLLCKVLKRRMRIVKEALLDDESTRELMKYIAHNKLQPDDYLFRKVGYRAIQFAITRYAKRAGINHKVSFHNFRHYFVTQMIKGGMTYDQVIKFTGHSSPSTLVHYDHVQSDELRVEFSQVQKNL